MLPNMRLKAGVSPEQFCEAVATARMLRGSSIAAHAMVALNLDREFHSLKTKRKRIRIKRMKKLLRRETLAGVFDLLEPVV